MKLLHIDYPYLFDNFNIIVIISLKFHFLTGIYKCN